MRTMLIQTGVKVAAKFHEILWPEISDFLIYSPIEEVNMEEIEVIILWLNVPNYLPKLQNLKLLLACNSGINHIIGSPYLSNLLVETVIGIQKKVWTWNRQGIKNQQVFLLIIGCYLYLFTKESSKLILNLNLN